MVFSNFTCQFNQTPKFSCLGNGILSFLEMLSMSHVCVVPSFYLSPTFLIRSSCIVVEFKEIEVRTVFHFLSNSLLRSKINDD